MSPFRTPSPSTTHKIKIAVAGVALAAAAAGTTVLWPAGAAGTAGRAGTASTGGIASTASTAGTAGQRLALALQSPTPPVRQPIVLDVFTTQALPAANSLKAQADGSDVKLTPKQIARGMLHSFHWSKWQFQWLNLLWSRESSWNVYATNPYSGAYGIPQAVPGDKMASAGPDWQTDARTQIRWGLDYIKDRYGSPYKAWEHELATGWY